MHKVDFNKTLDFLEKSNLFHNLYTSLNIIDTYIKNAKLIN